MEYTIEDYLITLSYLYIENAIYAMQVLNKAADNMQLDKSLTREQKDALRKDAGWSRDAVVYLTEAKKNYQSLCKYLDKLGDALDTKCQGKLYNTGQANALDIMSVDIVYLSMKNQDESAETNMQDFLKQFEWSDDLKKSYGILREMVDVFKYKEEK